MLKKLLILPILGSILGLGAFASATDYSISKNGNNYSPSTITFDSNVDLYVSSYSCTNAEGCGISFQSNTNWTISCNISDSNADNYKSTPCSITAGSYTVMGQNGRVFDSIILSDTLPTPPVDPDPEDTPDDFNSSLGIPEIPASFTSGLTSLVNNFGGTIANWLPTIILVALGIYAIFALFRVVRNYARSTFRG